MDNKFEIKTNEQTQKYKDAVLYLANTDYIANKIIEYQFLGKELDKDYTETLKKREEAREVIRNYEK
jgi:hypothetical protein